TLELPRCEAPLVKIVSANPACAPCRVNSSSSSTCSRVTGSSQTGQMAPLPFPPNVRSAFLVGRAPLEIAALAFSRRSGSSGNVHLQAPQQCHARCHRRPTPRCVTQCEGPMDGGREHSSGGEVAL